MNIVILPDQALQVIWVPAFDARRSPLTYVINATVFKSTDEPISTSVQHSISTVILIELSPYSAGSVLLQARNPVAVSEAVTAKFRMVNITGDGAIYTCFEIYAF